MHPTYTILNRSAGTFSNIWTPYEKKFSLFYNACVRDMDRYRLSAEFAPQRDMPPNVCNISSVPWIDFSAFHLHIYGEGTHLLPIFTIGKYMEQGGGL